MLKEYTEENRSSDIELTWLRLGLSVTVHRYFLHIDPLLTKVLGVAYRARKTLSYREEGVEYKLMDEWLLESVNLDDEPIYYFENNEIKSIFIGGEVADEGISNMDEKLVEAKKLLSMTMLSNIIDLTGLIFVAGTDKPRSLEASLLGIVFYNSDLSVEKIVEQIAFEAGRNLMILFLLSSREEQIKSTADIKKILNNISASCGSLIDRIGQGCIALIKSDPIDLAPKYKDTFKEVFRHYPSMAAEDFAKLVTKSKDRFRDYKNGLGVGQS